MRRYRVTLSSWYAHVRDMSIEVEADSMDDAVTKAFETIKPEDRHLWRENAVRTQKAA